jgi:hypothetical protein
VPADLRQRLWTLPSQEQADLLVQVREVGLVLAFLFSNKVIDFNQQAKGSWL